MGVWTCVLGLARSVCYPPSRGTLLFPVTVSQLLWAMYILAFIPHGIAVRYSVMGFQYWASTRLRYQNFDNHLEDEPRVGIPIRQSLQVSPNQSLVLTVGMERVKKLGPKWGTTTFEWAASPSLAIAKQARFRSKHALIWENLAVKFERLNLGVVKRGPCTFWATRYVGTFIYLYDRSTCRYVRLNALNVPHVPLVSSPTMKWVYILYDVFVWCVPEAKIDRQNSDVMFKE